MDRMSGISKMSQDERSSSGSDVLLETPSRPQSEYNYSRSSSHPRSEYTESKVNYPYPKLRKQQPPPKAAYHRQPQEWAQRSLSDLQTETPPATPGMGTPLRSLTPSATYLPEFPTSSFSPSPVRSQTSIAPLFPNGPSTYFTRERIRDGSIARLHDRDDVGLLTGWKRYAYYLAPILAILTWSLYWLYFGLRVRFVLSAQRQQHATFPLAWAFIAVEVSVAFPVFLQSSWSVFILKKRNRPKLRLLSSGNDVPTVDVLITCCGEDDELVLDTVRASCHLDYPMERFRVVILDDGKSDGLKVAIQEMAASYPNIYYRRRPKFPGVPHHFKAGNLNYGLEEVHNMPGGAGEFMAALDADMIPEQDWLRAILPHMLIDERIALACPPQLFYNIPAGDPLSQSLDFFVHVLEPVKDTLGIAWCTGSGYVVRREALDQIGNFPLGSLAEDVATSTLLLGRGWKTAYVHEPLQFGTVPDTFTGHLKQRTRWAIGTVDTSFKLKFFLWGDKIKKLTLAQRLNSFCYALMSLFNVILVVSLFAMPVILIQNKRLVAYANPTELRWLIRACFAALITNRLYDIVLFLPSGYFTGQRGAYASLWMCPYLAVTIIRSFVLPKWLGGQTQAFKPSGSLKSDLNERDARLRAPMYRRIRVVLFNSLAIFHLAYVYFCLTSVVLSSYRCILENTVDDRLMCLLTHAGWPPMTWIIVVSAFWIPITYACDPPTVPDREALLERDPKTGVAHPTAKSKTIAFKGQTALFEFEYWAVTAYTAAVFVAAFIF